MRLDKFLADCFMGTRSEVKNLIRKGRVKVNAAVVKKPETSVDENYDDILVDGIKVIYEKYHYIMINKPSGYVCSSNEKGEKSILSLVEEPFSKELFPVGRLDKDTTGLLLLTDDGPLCHELLSPKKHVDKEYEIVSKQPISEAMIECFEKGVDIGDEDLTLPAKLFSVSGSDSSNKSRIIIHEGRFHQIKRMFEACGNEVIGLKRLRMKNLFLDETLELGEYRRLTDDELDDLKGNDTIV